MFGLSALEDQECAGALMWTCVTLTFLVAAAQITLQLLKPNVGSVHGIERDWVGETSPESFSTRSAEWE